MTIRERLLELREEFFNFVAFSFQKLATIFGFPDNPGMLLTPLKRYYWNPKSLAENLPIRTVRFPPDTHPQNYIEILIGDSPKPSPIPRIFYESNTDGFYSFYMENYKNIISGFIGGLPMTAVIVRTSANVIAGGKTKLSAIFHGILLLLSVAFFATYLNQIPLPCLAAVLLVVGYKLAKISLFKEMYKLGWEQFLPFIITIIAIQFSDLLKGISLGMLVAIFYILRTNYRRDYKFHQDSKVDGGLITITLSEHVTFINKGSIANKLSHIKNNANVVIEGKDAHFIDLDVLEILYDFKESAKQKNIQVELKKQKI